MRSDLLDRVVELARAEEGSFDVSRWERLARGESEPERRDLARLAESNAQAARMFEACLPLERESRDRIVALIRGLPRRASWRDGRSVDGDGVRTGETAPSAEGTVRRAFRKPWVFHPPRLIAAVGMLALAGALVVSGLRTEEPKTLRTPEPPLQAATRAGPGDVSSPAAFFFGSAHVQSAGGSHVAHGHDAADASAADSGRVVLEMP